MTYSPTTQLENTAKPSEKRTLMPTPYSGPVAAAQRRLLALLWFWICKLGRLGEQSGRDRHKPKMMIARFVILIILSAMRGTPPEKTALLKRLLRAYEAKRAALYTKLHAAYIVWRQRKCWMWGGGFMLAMTSPRLNSCAAVKDKMSFDALIPD